MTAVVGILTQSGVALAADSAVTRTRGRQEKITKNGNKMLRLSNRVPICVMITGNGDFLRKPWDVIIRRYRQLHGDVAHSTVEKCVEDFFSFISKEKVFWEDKKDSDWIEQSLDNLIDHINGEIPWTISRFNTDGRLQKPKTFLKTFVNKLAKFEKKYQKNSRCPQFENYSFQEFREYVGPIVEKFFDKNTNPNNDDDIDNSSEIYKQLLSIREEIEHALMSYLSSRNEDGPSATLVFSGFGSDEDYPTLVSANVCEGFDHRVNYHTRPNEIIKISKKRPVAICPFAQDDVVRSILRGIHEAYSEHLCHNIRQMYILLKKSFSEEAEGEYFDNEFFELLNQVDIGDQYDKFCNSGIRRLDSNQHVWEKALEKYDLQALASLAERLIDLTGFHRILTFRDEGVGGPVDLAVISKTEGFTWLSRKSWYHHKDVNGQYGKFGV